MRSIRPSLILLTVLGLAGAVLLTAFASSEPDGEAPGGARDPACEGLAQAAERSRANERAARAWIDRCVRLNEIQVLGTHNSYKIEPHPPLLAALATFDQELADSFEYTHEPLTAQLAELGIRQFELDVFADPEGGLYADPVGHRLFPDPLFDPERSMMEPGFKVLHVQDIDYRTTCPTLIACLEEIRRWSDANRDHLPIMVLVEAKDSEIPDPLDLGFVKPIPIREAELDALEAELRSVFPSERVITPDDVRGEHETLLEAIRERGWPTLGEARGKVLFALDNTGIHRSLYLEGNPSLEGRVMFVSSEPPEPSAAFVKRNNPLGDNLEEIQALVAEGLVVRTRADTPTVEARSGDTTRRDAALASGAQWVSTDYPLPSRWAGYVVELPEGDVARCNPITTWPGCRFRLLE